MPPKSAPKADPTPGPHPHFRMDVPRSLGHLDELYDLPEIQGKTMPIDIFVVLYGSWHWYDIGGRRLLREDILCIADVCYGGLKRLKNDKVYFRKLESTNFEGVFATVEEQERNDILVKVEELYRSVLERDPEARARSDDLEGFQGRLPPIPWRQLGTRPVIDFHVLWDSQICLIYALGNWCKDSQGNNTTESIVEAIFCEHYDYSTPKMSTIFGDLKDPEHPRAITTAAAMVERRHREYFGRKAYTLCEEFTTGKGLGKPQLVVPGVPQSGPDPTATTNIEALSLTVTASSSAQRTAPGQSQRTEPDAYISVLDQFTNHKTWGNQPDDASQSPDEASSKELAVKGKGRARDSTSSSPGEGGSGKATVKRPKK